MNPNPQGHRCVGRSNNARVEVFLDLERVAAVLVSHSDIGKEMEGYRSIRICMDIRRARSPAVDDDGDIRFYMTDEHIAALFGALEIYRSNR